MDAKSCISCAVIMKNTYANTAPRIRERRMKYQRRLAINQSAALALMLIALALLALAAIK